MAKSFSDKKIRYVEKLTALLTENTRILIVDADFVGSNQIQLIRAAIRGRAEILMGKNTQIRRVMREVAEDNPSLLNFLPHIKGNCGLVFTNEDIKEIRDIVVSFRVPAAAKAGTVAPVDVFVPPGPTGLDPGQTAFFQSLGIATKIVRGSVEILYNVHLIKAGEKVGNSETALLSKLNIKPFSYGFVPVMIYDYPSVYPPAIIDISSDELLQKFFRGVSQISALGLEVGYPCLATIPHSLANGLKKLFAVAIETDYSFPQVEMIKAYMADPSAFAVVEEKQEEASEEQGAGGNDDDDDGSDSDFEGGGMGIFGGDSDSDSDSDDSD